MSKAAIEAIKQDLKDVQGQIRNLQKEENKLDRALALLTTTNPNVGATKRTGDETKVIVRTAARTAAKPKTNGKVTPSVAKDRARSATMVKPRDMQAERPAWGVEKRGANWHDKYGLTVIGREILKLLLFAPGYRKSGAEIREESTIYISSGDSSRWLRVLEDRELVRRAGEVPARGAQGRASIAYQLTGLGLKAAQQISREDDGGPSEIRLHAGVGEVR